MRFPLFLLIGFIVFLALKANNVQTIYTLPMFVVVVAGTGSLLMLSFWLFPEKKQKRKETPPFDFDD